MRRPRPRLRGRCRRAVRIGKARFSADPAAIGERHTALCNYCLRLCAAADPDWATAPQLIKPIYLSVPEEQVDRIWREFSRRIAQRQAAARMVIPFLRQASGTAPRLPPGIPRLSLNSLAEVAAADLKRLSKFGNVETRIWRPSLGGSSTSQLP